MLLHLCSCALRGPKEHQSGTGSKNSHGFSKKQAAGLTLQYHSAEAPGQEREAASDGYPADPLLFKVLTQLRMDGNHLDPFDHSAERGGVPS